MKSPHKGFTLIELLVVVAIIGILATIVLSSLSKARSRARDAQREQDINTIKTALEMYYLDNGKYPNTSWRGSHTSNWASFETLLGTNLPKDPLNTSESINDSAAVSSSTNYVYTYYSASSSIWCTNQAYMLVYNKENSNGTGPNDGVRVCDDTVYSYGDAFVTGVSPRTL